MEEKEYIKGFNYGYEFKQHKPLLFETVAKGLQEETPFRAGFRDGGKEYEIERGKDLLSKRSNNTIQAKNQERDR